MGTGGPCKLWASPDSNPANAGSSYWCGEYCAGGGAGEDSAMSRTGWLGVPLGVTFNSSSAVYARMQGWKSPKGAVVHAWMDSSWFTNMFEVTGVDLKAGNLSFEDTGDFAGHSHFRCSRYPMLYTPLISLRVVCVCVYVCVCVCVCVCACVLSLSLSRSLSL